MTRSYRNQAGYRMGRQCPVGGKASFPSTTAAWTFISNLDNWKGGVAYTYRCIIAGGSN